MFQDESRFGRINEPKRCWAPEQTRPDAPCQIVREYTYAYAAVSPIDGVLDTLILPYVDSEGMSLFLQEVASRHENEYIIMFMDKAGWHRSKTLQVPENMKILYLPPYSPNLNPVENIWKEVKEKFFKNFCFNSMKQVESSLCNALAILEKDTKKISSISGFDWIINAILNAT